MTTLHHNYVVLFKDGRLKFGRTANVQRRLRHFKDVYVCIEGRPVLPVIARFVEIQIRQHFKGRTVPGTFEWIPQADKNLAVTFGQMTARLQDQLIAGIAA